VFASEPSRFADYAHAEYVALDHESHVEQHSASLIDMDTMNKDFILERKKIEFSDYPDAFNPSMIKWKGKILMSFRTYVPETKSTNPFALVWLNDDFEPISVPQVFQLPFHNPVLPSKQRDPRLLAIDDRLFVIYNNILENVINREIRRMFIVEFYYDGKKFTAGQPECLYHFDESNDNRYEKNWVPFEYNKELLLAYSIIPHRIVRPVRGQNGCEEIVTTTGKVKWDWGPIFGGTQAFLDGDHYLAFFHSWKDFASIQSNGRKISHYVMGAYIFDAHPPFAITAASPNPIVAEHFYRPPYHKTWKPMRCIFPAGLIIEKDHVWICYGRQDHEVWVAKLDKKKLLDSMVPVKQK
jgi:predicted GH43/DUF377 family glycosyl hydrolase